MPVTPLPASNTKRYQLLLRTPNHTHKLTARAADGFSDSVAIAHLAAVAATLQEQVGNNCTFSSVLVAEKNSNIFNPVSGWTPVTGTSGAMLEVNEPLSICISGRSSTGRKSKAYLYGITSVTTPVSYVQEPIAVGAISGFQGLLNSQADFWLAIDGTKPVWYNRATWTYNDHFIATARK